MAVIPSEESQAHRIGITRRHFFKQFALLVGGAASLPLFGTPLDLSPFATRPNRVAGSVQNSQTNVMIFAGSEGSTAINRLSAAGYMPALVGNLTHAQAIFSAGVTLVGIGSGVAAALQFAQSRPSVKTVILFNNTETDSLAEFQALRGSRSFSVLTLGEPDADSWVRALNWIEQVNR
jgi:hypothetical protein